MRTCQKFVRQAAYGLSRNYDVIFRAPDLAETHKDGPSIMSWQINGGRRPLASAGCCGACILLAKLRNFGTASGVAGVQSTCHLGRKSRSSY